MIAADEIDSSMSYNVSQISRCRKRKPELGNGGAEPTGGRPYDGAEAA